MGVVPLALIGGVLGGSQTAGAGAAVFGVDYFISAPLVQGSYVSLTSEFIQETFDGYGSGPCPSSLASGAITVTAGVCTVSALNEYGGASSTGATANVDDAGSNYATTGGTGLIEFTMSAPQRYLGFWWSAGSASNAVTFYSGETEILILTTAEVFALFGSAPTNEVTYLVDDISTVESNDPSIEATNESAYFKHHYFGNPRGYSSTSPTGAEWNSHALAKSEPFVYLHIFSKGGLYFDRVVFSGGGFEFDNFVVSPLAQTPNDSLVPVGGVEGEPPPDFEPDSRPRTPSIDLDHYLVRTELPDTGAESGAVAWIGACLVLGGGALTVRVRRSRVRLTA
jgi:LPXTG-motif cell wall-anchored protein